MSLIKSISGIRGTIGGKPGENLTPLDIVKFSAAYGMWIRRKGDNITIVIGRDGRKSGPEVAGLVSTTLLRLGLNVIDLGFATTPTVEMAVVGTGSAGGIIITASHNPAQWNALKLLNEKGEFLSSADGVDVLAIAADEDFDFAPIDHEGKYIKDDSWNRKHIEKICALELVDVDAIKSANFKVALDCVNSVGGIILPDLLNALGVKSHIGLNMTPNGCFAHNPEPLPENLQDIMTKVVEEKADLAFVVDPDVDRLAIVCEDGSYFGEEYTLVAVSDYILSNKKGCTVSNMSSSMALQVVSNEHGCDYFSAPVGEVNVVTEMKKRGAVIGGEGNGGVIYPELHYGRDALV
ncbi:MAG: phosphoglucosamine mutase, partial [Bacteroidales bacterium]|nr:phosphoglucosamine mutase [Bacteroidales bacterium]